MISLTKKSASTTKKFFLSAD